MVKIETGKYRIIDSGVVISAGLNDDISIIVTPGEDNNFTFTVKWIFEVVEKQPYSIAHRVDADNGIVYIKCTNFDNALGTGTIVPFELARIGEKALCVQFWGYLLGDISGGCRKLDYTFYIEK